MLNNEELRKELDGAINWIKEYVQKTRANGVVVRK